MKFSVPLFLVSIGAASAFVAPAAKRGCPPLQVDPKGFGDEYSEIKDVSQTAKAPPKMSQALPFANRPKFLDGTMAGDVGFDPFGLVQTKTDLKNYREAEIKHARLAMLAAAGWPLSELFDKKIAGIFGLVPILDEANRVPSVLNGGMGKVSPIYWAACVLFAALTELYVEYGASGKPGYYPGKLGFDPFGLYPKDEEGQKRMETAEIKNGRLAMIAITAFAAQEFVSHIAIVDQVPFFFKPIWQVLSDGVPGYIDHANEAAESTQGMFEDLSAPSAIVEAAPLVDAAPLVTPPVEAITAPITAPIVEAPSFPMPDFSTPAAVAPPPPAMSAPVVDNTELIEAKRKIAELEARLAQIGGVSR